MARQILSLYKEDCSFVGDKTYANGDMDWYFKVSNSSRDAATKKYNDAIKNGLLNQLDYYRNLPKFGLNRTDVVKMW